MNDSSSMRILFVGGSDLHSPDEKQFLEFASNLAARGHDVRLMLRAGSPDYDREEDVSPPPRVSIQSYRLVGRRTRSRDVATVRRFAPTLIHAIYPRGTVLAACRQWGRATGAPLFVHFGDDEWGLLSGPPGGSPRERAERIARRVVGRIYPWVWPYSTPGWLRFAVRDAVALDALTPALATEVLARSGRSCAVLLPAFSMPEDMDATVAGRVADAFAEGPVALYTGAILDVHEPDFRIGLRALAEVQRRGVPVRLVHAGPTDGRRDPLRLAEEEGMEPGTAITLGYLPMAELLPLLSKASVLLQPGRPSEFNRLRLPSKLQAYLASGTPTITFAVGFGELVEDRSEVLKTYTGGPAELADRIMEALQDRDLRARLSEGGPSAARRLFDPVENSVKLEEHYRAALRFN